MRPFFGAIVSSCLAAALAFAPPNVVLVGRPLGPGRCSNVLKSLHMAIDASKIKAISLDVTGTILVHRSPIMETYAAAAVWARLPNPPTVEDLKPAFKKAYKKHCTESPCFGHAEGLSSRQWWTRTVRSALAFCGRDSYTEEEFQRFFRRVYQHYGSLDGYDRLPDAAPFLAWARDEQQLTMGVTTNTPVRTMETVLPMTGHMDFFKWYVCSQDVGIEKPGAGIFERAYQEAQFWMGPLEKDEILHIGDSFEADYCGARAFGFQALYLDRSQNARVTVYQDWLTAPEYPGKSEEDIKQNTVTDLAQVRLLLQPPLATNRANSAAAAVAVSVAVNTAASSAEQETGAYDDSNEVDRTTIQGHVTQTGEQISALLPDVVRGELIETATDESDVTEEAWQAEYIRAFGVPPPMEKLYDDETRAQQGWFEGEVDRDRETERAKSQGWLSGEGAVREVYDEEEEEEEEEAGDADYSPQARFMRDRQRMRAKGIVKGAAATEAALLAGRTSEMTATDAPAVRMAAESGEVSDWETSAKKSRYAHLWQKVPAAATVSLAPVSSLKGVKGRHETAAVMEEEAWQYEEEDDESGDSSPEARFVRDRQRLRAKGIAKGAAATDAALPPTSSSQRQATAATVAEPQQWRSPFKEPTNREAKTAPLPQSVKVNAANNEVSSQEAGTKKSRYAYLEQASPEALRVEAEAGTKKSRYAHLFDGAVQAPPTTGSVTYTRLGTAKSVDASKKNEKFNLKNKAAPAPPTPAGTPTLATPPPVATPAAAARASSTQVQDSPQPASTPPAVGGGGVGGEATEYVSAAKRDAMKKRDWEKRNLQGKSSQDGLDEQMAAWRAAAEGGNA